MIKALLALACILYFYSAWAPFLCGQNSQIPPDVLMVNDLNCVIRQHGPKWTATCTASYLNHDRYHRDPWSVQFPERKNEPAANKDADKWLQAVRKIQAAALPVDVKQLKKEKQ